jgi:hypothetical protein
MLPLNSDIDPDVQYNEYCIAAADNQLELVHRLLNHAACFAEVESRGTFVPQFIPPFVKEKIKGLRKRQQAFAAEHPKELFDLENTNEVHLCLFMLRYLIRRKDHRLVEDMRCLLSLPSVKEFLLQLFAPLSQEQLALFREQALPPLENQFIQTRALFNQLLNGFIDKPHFRTQAKRALDTIPIWQQILATLAFLLPLILTALFAPLLPVLAVAVVTCCAFLAMLFTLYKTPSRAQAINTHSQECFKRLSKVIDTLNSPLPYGHRTRSLKDSRARFYRHRPDEPPTIPLTVSPSL